MKSIAMLAVLCATAGAAPVKPLVDLFTRAIQTHDPEAMDGVLSDDFTAFVGGWGPTTCVTYDKAGFIAHVAAWQSTWATNYTLFDVRHSVQSGNSMALVLTIAYWSKPNMPGGSVNADEVMQFFWTNDDGTQLTGFLELSGLVQPANAKEMLDQSWNPYVDGVNAKNVSLITDSLADDVKLTWYTDGATDGPARFTKEAMAAELKADFATRINPRAMFSSASGATCTDYTWGYANQFDQKATAEDSRISFLVAYNRLNADGQIVEGGAWMKSGMATSAKS